MKQPKRPGWRMLWERGLDLAQTPELLAYCPILDVVTSGEERLCSGRYSCWDCEDFWSVIPDPGTIRWVCCKCGNRPDVVMLGYYGTGQGAPWAREEETEVRCQICSKVSMILQAARLIVPSAG